MQGVVLMSENPQQGSPPPSSVIVTDMEQSFETKEHHIEDSTCQNDSGVFSATNTTIEQSANSDSDNQSDRSTPERKYRCPICQEMLSSQHKFTLHIRSHNNDAEDQDNDKGYTCKICFKVLSSSSSLDRHVLVHSGERPFHCKFCGDTFTTNGNMHRHMRTHSAKLDSYESDGSSDSGSSKSVEFNNNNNSSKVDSKNSAKRKLESAFDEDFSNNKKREINRVWEENSQYYKCPLCERADFNSIANLETHLEDNHPDYPAKCGICQQTFPNNKSLIAHKAVVHEHNTPKPIVVGFKDLSFVDFSSQKFPYIARQECEKNIHKATGTLKFQCRKCSKAFPCASSLESHERNCLILPPIDLNKNSNVSEDEIRRTEFFSNLNLQDNSPEKKLPLVEALARMDNKADLADIQSILTNINMPQFDRKQIKVPPPKPVLDIDQYKNEPEEESQDFVLEFRKMKLRGEFPCRLCTAVFPNLRALKGHNRTHLNGNNNGTYYCNMCPHSSIDKAALVRHMRTHNGDRPYECALCNYAFTTKANCERHLRNRHSKTTREDVKKSIIYHPSEDPTNEDLNKLTIKEETKKHHLPTSPVDSVDVSPERLHSMTPKLPIPEMSQQKLFPNMDFLRNQNLESLKESRLLIPPFLPPPFNMHPKLSSTLPQQTDVIAPKIQVKPFEALKENNAINQQSDEEYFEEEEEEEEEEEVALDLSKKKMDEEKKRLEEEKPQDLTKKESLIPQEIPEPMQGIKDKFAHNVDPALYLHPLFSLGLNNLPWTGFPVNPFLLFNRTPADLKEKMRLQLTGGSVMEGLKTMHHIHHNNPVQTNSPALINPMGNFNGFKSNTAPSPETKPENIYPQISPKKIDVPKPLMLNTESTSYENIPKIHSPHSQTLKSDMMQSQNSVKMVIKNGVLMPKQKQRRYRTERPFTCEHCSARFTLRSNMERHIKQQHPQCWAQRQRTNVGQPGRKPQNMLLKPNYSDLYLSSYDMPKMHDFDEAKEHYNEKLKYALLAQQLQANHINKEVKKEDDEDCALVIDENDKSDDGPKIEYDKSQILEEKLTGYHDRQTVRQDRSVKTEEDLVPVSRLLDNASQQQFAFFKRDGEEQEMGIGSEEDEEGLVASGSTSEGNVSGTDENRSESEASTNTVPVKRKSAYSLAPNRVSCPYCNRKFPWKSSLRRHVLTHTGQKPFKCSHCPLLFTTKSNCDRHLLRKHGNSATTIVTSEASNANGVNFLMRNVPERPFKCHSCPSSTFSTYSNLKKHMSCKHSSKTQSEDVKAQGYEAGSSEDEKANQSDNKNEWEKQIAYNKFPVVNNLDVHAISQTTNSDLPFKCHLCEGSFGERDEALDHIRDKHASEYDLLMSKNALDTNASTPDDAIHHDDEENDIRGKFPDYSNRKVICAWCMRRFWSAEDLRRHMRTHTGERPFSCDVCRRRFTLKHSMLRHKKKHTHCNNLDTTHSDEDGGGAGSPSMEAFVKAEKDDAATKLGEKSEESDAQEGGGDLICNLLGLRDRSIVDKALDASADDAAQMLGVKN